MERGAIVGGVALETAARETGDAVVCMPPNWRWPPFASEALRATVRSSRARVAKR